MTTRVEALDWDELRRQLDDRGFAITPPLLDAGECARARRAVRRRPLPLDDRHGPPPLRRRPLPLLRPPAAGADRGAARTSFYAPPGADRQRLGGAARGDEPPSRPPTRSCSSAAARPARTRPTPLILRYGEGDWNALHQDLYGDVYFPFQVADRPLEPGSDFEGGEFVLVEQRPRAQSRAHVLTPPPGAFVIFPTRDRPNRASAATTGSACATA